MLYLQGCAGEKNAGRVRVRFTAAKRCQHDDSHNVRIPSGVMNGCVVYGGVSSDFCRR